MNREKAKSFLPIIQAFADGKTIQRLDESNNWTDSLFMNVEFGSPKEYRIKPESKYRPFINAEECIEEMKKHVPFSWVKDKYSFYPISMIGTNFSKECIKSYGIWSTSEQIFKDATFLDGTPFGVKIEED